MLRRVAIVRTDVSEELSASFIRVTGIGELVTTLAVTSNRRTLRRNTNFFAACGPNKCKSQENVDLYIQSPLHLHVLVFIGENPFK
jgi:hypothetical protein